MLGMNQKQCYDLIKKIFAYFWCFVYFSSIISSLGHTCSSDSLFLKSDDVIIEINVEVADKPKTRKQGLMHRDHLAPLSGMFFVFDKPQKVNFWMKNTPISLDIIFVNQEGVVKKVVEKTIPYSKDLIYGGSDIQYVLELGSGIANELNIKNGTELMHPLIKKEFILPCEN